MSRRRRLSPTKRELRIAIQYVRAQMRVMFPKRNPRRHPKYRETVLKVAAVAARHRALAK